MTNVVIRSMTLPKKYANNNWLVWIAWRDGKILFKAENMSGFHTDARLHSDGWILVVNPSNDTNLYTVEELSANRIERPARDAM